MASFAAGNIVRLREDKSFEGKLFQAGTLGTVVAAVQSMNAALLLLGHDTTTRLVSNGSLELVAEQPGSPGKKKGKALRFAEGERVKLREERVYDGLVYPRGSPGTVTVVLQAFLAYLVDFDQDSTDRMVPDSALDRE
jgi:hypothetical protein